MKSAIMAAARSFLFLMMVNGAPVLAEVDEGTIVPYDSAHGQQLLNTSEYRGDFSKLSRYFITQDNMGFCSVASSVMALNALGIEKPEVEKYRGYRLFTQENFFTAQVQTHLTPEYVRRHGMNLHEVEYALSSHGVDIQVIEGDNLTSDEIRGILVESLNDPEKIVLSEYHRQALGQVGVGHFSPIAAYNAAADMLLIMDVSRYKYPPIWVETNTFLQALQGGDSAGDPLGLIVVSS